MTLGPEEKRAIIQYRMQKAYNSLTEARDNGEMGHWTLAASRLYYAAYYALSALLTVRNIVTRTHAGLIRVVGLEFVSKEVLTKEEGKLLSRLFDMRQSGDYDDFFEWTEEDVRPYFEKTEQLIHKIEELIRLEK